MKSRSVTLRTILAVARKNQQQIKKIIICCLSMLIAVSICKTGAIVPSTDEILLECENQLRAYIENPANTIDTKLYRLEVDGTYLSLSSKTTFASVIATLKPDGSYSFTVNDGNIQFALSYSCLGALLSFFIYWALTGITFFASEFIKFLQKCTKKLINDYKTCKVAEEFSIKKEDAQGFEDTLKLKAAFDSGYSDGYEEGFFIGRKEGYANGRDDAYKEGYLVGECEAYQKAMDRYIMMIHNTEIYNEDTKNK